MKLSRIILNFLFFFSSFVICFGQQLPEFFGVYVVANGQLIELKENNINYKFPNKGGGQVDCMFGLGKLSNVDFNDTKGYLIIFLENFDINSIKLSKLRFVNAEPLTSFPIIGNPEDVMTNINMWVKEKDVPFKKGPIEGKKGMYKIAPNLGFEPGVYALHQGGIRRERVAGGALGVYMAAKENGSSAFDFSFNLGKVMNENTVAIEPKATKAPSEPEATKIPSPNKPIIEATEENLKNLLDKTLALIVKARKLSNVNYIIQWMDEATNNMDIALDLANKLKNVDAANGIEKATSFIKSAKQKYAADPEQYGGMRDHKEAINVLEKYLKPAK